MATTHTNIANLPPGRRRIRQAEPMTREKNTSIVSCV